MFVNIMKKKLVILIEIKRILQGYLKPFYISLEVLFLLYRVMPQIQTAVALIII